MAQGELTVADFSGGITDNYVGAPSNKYQKADNFMLEFHGQTSKLITRSGGRVFDTDYARATGSDKRPAAIKVFETNKVTFVERSIYHYDEDNGWVKVLGPSGNEAFSSSTTESNVVSYSVWNKHLLVSNDDLTTLPSKLYYQAAVTGSVSRASNTLTLTGHTLTNGMLVEYTASSPVGGLTTATKYFVVGVSGNDFQLSLTQGGSAIVLSGTPSGDHTFTPVSPSIRTAGLPEIDGSGVGFTKSHSEGHSYVYKLVYSYDYSIGTVDFQDLGPTEQLATVTNAPNMDTGGRSIQLTSIPVLSNTASTNYDTTRIKVKIYRTTNAGIVFFYVGEITNGTTTYTDTTNNTNLQLNALLYTEGGVLDNDPAPIAKIVHVANTDVAYYVGVKEGDEFRGNKVRPSIPGDVDACSLDVFAETEEDIIGFSSVQAFGIALCQNSAYRLEGVVDELGRGSIQRFKISDTCSCVSSQSVVQTLEGVFWAGKDAFYYTDGYRVIKINEDWPTTYKSLVSTDAKKSKIQGKYDSFNRRIVWTVQESDASLDNDKLYVLHLKAGVSENSSFTTASNEDYFFPTAIEFDGDDMIRSDKRGYIIIHEPDLTTDPKIDTAVAASLWNTVYIPFDYRGAAMNFGTDLVRKYATNIILTCKNKSNISVQIKSNNDDNKKVSNLKPIRFRGNIVWGDPNIVWGNDDLIWNFDGLIENRLWFPKGSLRFSYKQIQLSNAFVAIYNSEALSTVNVDSTAKTVTLTDATVSWPTDIVDYFVSFASDSYVKEYRILTRDSALQFTYQDALNQSSSSTGGSFVIRGYPKGEVLNVLSYTVAYIAFGDTQQGFTKRSTGEVGVSSYGAE